MDPRTRRFWLGPMPWLAAMVLFAALAALRWLGERPPQDPRPFGGVEELLALSKRGDVNVLFVLVDTLRAARLHTYGYDRPTTPFLDPLAYHGVRFARHLSQSSWTKCSMASLWTALNPQRSGVTRFDDVLPQEAVLAAEVLREAGFRTAGIWRNGWVENNFGFDQGFEIYTRPAPRGIPATVRAENPTERFAGTDLDLVESAREFLRVHGRQRWFLYLHMMDVHEYTYSEESAVFGSRYSDIYDNAILHTNHVLNELSALLYAGGFLTNTLIVIAADHGEAFGERGTEGHARNVYPETTEVPLVFGLPFRLVQPAVVRSRTANVDIWPTLLDLLGLPALAGVDGRSRVPEIVAAIRGEPGPEPQGAAIAHLDQSWGQRVDTTSPMVTVSEDGYRYAYFRGPKGMVHEELYDANRGGGERENRLDAEPEVAGRLREHAEQYLAQQPKWQQAPDLEINEMQLNQLRALGYAVP